MSPLVQTEEMKEARKEKDKLKKLSQQKLHWYSSEPSKQSHNYMVSLSEAALKQNEELRSQNQGLQESVQALAEELAEAHHVERDADTAYNTLSSLFNEQREKLDKFEEAERRFKAYEPIGNGKTFALCFLASALIAVGGYFVYKHFEDLPIFNIRPTVQILYK